MGSFFNFHFLRFQLTLFLSVSWNLRKFVEEEYRNDYLTNMARHTTYAAHLFNLRVVIFSSLGPEYDRIVQPEFENPIRTVTIGHYGEGSGLHYVCIDPNGTDDLNRVLSHADPRCKDECRSLLDERLDEEFLHISSPVYSDNPVIGDPSVGLHATTMTQLYGHNEDNFWI